MSAARQSNRLFCLRCANKEVKETLKYTTSEHVNFAYYIHSTSNYCFHSIASPTMNYRRETIREACDNCHVKKLRCERVSGLIVCRKCLQGEISCNFSPRSSAGHRRRRKNVSRQDESQMVPGKDSRLTSTLSPEDTALESETLKSFYLASTFANEH